MFQPIANPAIPEAVAYNLMCDIFTSGEESGEADVNREKILTTYKECLTAVRLL